MYRRRSIRLAEYDYRTGGAYFVTICAHQRRWLFEEPVLNKIVMDTWNALPERFPTIALDEFVIMPNHIHFIVWLNDLDVAPTLGNVVGTFKSLIARDWLRWIKNHAPQRSGRVWQRNYYERIVQNDNQLDAIRAYIRDNPTRWLEDRDNLPTLVARMTCHEG